MIRTDLVEEKILRDCQLLLNNLAQIDTIEDFLSKKDTLYTLLSNLNFIEILRENEQVEQQENQESREVLAVETVSELEPAEEPTELETYQEKEEIHFEFTSAESSSIEEELPQAEEKESINIAVTETPSVSDIEPEKKIKLAHIRGISTHTLFDEETLEGLKEPSPETLPVEETKQGSAIKLDLNDKIAFMKILFAGSQVELNETIRQLNNFDDIEQAREYLSDIYYERGWDQVDEYAQRLWSLVENKFM